jgi:hypothetical protein
MPVGGATSYEHRERARDMYYIAILKLANKGEEQRREICMPSHLHVAAAEIEPVRNADHSGREDDKRVPVEIGACASDRERYKANWAPDTDTVVRLGHTHRTRVSAMN